MSRRTPTFNVLAFRGGGARGALSGRFLARLCREVPDLLHETMLFAGTSTGGIIALGLAHGLSPGALVGLYQDNATRIFDKRLMGGVIGSKYASDGLRAILEETFGDTTLAQLQRHVLVPALDLDSPASGHRPRRARAVFFDARRNPHARVVDVLMATTAAPSFFPVSPDGYVDGGLVANSPAAHAAVEALKLGAPRDSLRVLSLGTGLSPSFIAGGGHNWGGLRWAPKIAPLCIDPAAEVSDHLCAHLLAGQYHELDLTLPRAIALDAADEVDALIEMADAVDIAPTVAWLREAGWSSSAEQVAS